MKRLADLTADDLRAIPVWIYQGDDDAAAIVIPTQRDSLTETERDTYIAATEFTLRDGSVHFGFCSPVDPSGLDYLQPVILSPAGPVRFWFDQPVGSETLKEQYSRLGVSEAAVFPVRYRCLIPVDRQTVEGVIARVESGAGAT